MRFLPAAVVLLLAAAAAAEGPPRPDLAERIRLQDAQVDGGKAAQALEEARASVEKTPADPDSLYLLGRLLGNAGKVEEARVQFEAALAADPNHAASWRGMATVHLRRDDAEAALREARRAWELGQDPESLQVLVMAHYAKGERPAAYRLLEEEIAKRPKESGLRLVLAGLLLQEGNFRDGEKELRQVIAQSPDDPRPREILVAVLLKAARKDEAIDECRAALERGPRNARLLLQLYDLLVAKGDLASAAAVLEKVLECDLDPKLREKTEALLKKVRLAVADGPPPPAEADPADLAKRLQSPDAAVRREAMRVVWEAEFTGGGLARMVLDEDETVRLYAVRILGRSRIPATVSVLEALLYAPVKPESSVPVRTQAALALGEIGEPAVLPILFRCVEEEKSEEVLRAALKSVRRITGKTFAEDAEAPVPEAERAAVRAACREWWMNHPTGKHWRRKAAASAGDTGEPCLARYCVPWVAEDDPAMRAAALDALARLSGDPKWREAPTETKEQQAAVLERAAALLEGK